MLVEFEVDKLQKNNESEFYLDDEFYDRLKNEFKDKQNPPAVSPADIQIDVSEKSNKTEDEEDEDNPFDDRIILAQTSDGRRNDLKRALSRFATNVDEPERENEDNAQEEEKRMEQSLLNENLEI